MALIVNTVMGILTFSDYIESPSDHEPDWLADDADLMASMILREALSASVAKTAATGFLMKLSQLRQRVTHDRNADNADRSITSMLVLVGSMVAVAIGMMCS